MRKLVAISLVVLVFTAALLIYKLAFSILPQETIGPLRVGLLYSSSGPLSPNEIPLRDVVKMALDEVNASGVLSREVVAVETDCQSDPRRYAEEAARLIRDEGVSTIFGCWISASRKAVRPVVEEEDHLLYYPVLYEGIEQSPNIIYVGAAPNQQILPGLRWAVLNFGKRAFLVAPDYVYGHSANAIIRDQLRAWRGTVVGEEYIRIIEDDTHIEAVVQKIVEQRPDVILNNLFGESYRKFVLALRAAGVTPKSIPQMSFAVSEVQLRQFAETDGYAPFAGDYAVANYFMSLPGEQNRRFVEAYQQQFGQESVTDDFLESHYVSVFLWAEAARRAASGDVDKIRAAAADIAFHGPSGIFYVDPETRHTWRHVYVGRLGDDGQVRITWSSGRPVPPEPYPEFRTPEQWEAGLRQLYLSWNESWTNMSDAPSVAGASFQF